ncbi:MAG: site-specific integrase [Hyphomicrobium sp.]
MKGHIRKRGKTSWAIVLEIGHGPDGKRRQKWHSIKGNRKDAERELARLVHEFNLGNYVEPSRLTVREYLERWLSDYAATSVSAKTCECYRDMISAHITPALGNHKLSKLRPLHVQSFYSVALASGRKDGKGGLSAQSVLHFHRLLHRAFVHAVKWQLIARNVIDAVEPPRVEKLEMRALTEGETAKLIAVVKTSRVYVAVMLALTTGLRRGEVLALRWADIDLDSAGLAVNQSLEQTRGGLRFKAPKTSKSRRAVALPALAVEILREHRIAQTKERLALGSAYEDNGLVCARQDGSPWPPDTFSTAFASLIRRSNIPHLRFHDLRHTHATQLLRQGVHPKIVSERLGHSTIAITLDTYSHVLPGMQEDAAAKIDAALRVAMEDVG